MKINNDRKYSTETGKHTYNVIRSNKCFIPFKNEFKDDCKKYNITLKIFNLILKKYYTEISRLIIEECFDYRIPFKLGYLKIKSFKLNLKIVNGKLDKKKLTPDYAATRKWYMKNFPIECPTYHSAMLYLRKLKLEGKDRKILYHYNDHTSGYTYRWHWNKGFSSIINITIYKFIPIRRNKKAISDWVKKNNNNVNYYTDLKTS